VARARTSPDARRIGDVSARGRTANPLVGNIVPLSVSAIEHWARCKRFYRNKHLLRLPETSTPRDHGLGRGLLVHEALYAVHIRGGCGDASIVDSVVAELAPGAEPEQQLRWWIEQHARHCNPEADWQSHEHELARFHRLPPPMWMLTGKIDALWLRGGVLEARDYKTGRRFCERVADDPAARAQAWLLAPLAAQLDATIRVVYEHPALDRDDWPEPYEPEGEDITAAEGELGAVAAAIAGEVDFRGVGDPPVCKGCGYGGICPDARLQDEDAG
jgi:PD-(D/E)XK nuclease superfamily